MAEQLVTHIRLGSVQRAAAVSDVLGTVEHTERQASEEIT